MSAEDFEEDIDTEYVEREEARQQQSVERFSLIAEYDAISESRQAGNGIAV